jgi:predicted nucleic acid-binding protein
LNAVVEALRWMRAGMDFADALHLASVGQADRFATFDRGLIKRAQKVAGIKVVQA